jgi:hypothetical protein
MSTREFFSQRLKIEIPAFVKVVQAMPEDQLEYKPHDKNTPAGTLAWQIATEMLGLVQLLDTGTIDYRMAERPPVADIASGIERDANTVVERVLTISDEQWTGPGKFLYNGQNVWESTVDDIAWGFLFDMVHHRGQLSAYLRPMGGKVPAIYGPSADTK